MPQPLMPETGPFQAASRVGAGLGAERPLSLPPLLAEEARRMPLAGLTVLVVEDSRFACDALRLMCQRLGARLRRAETLAAARAHLRTYRPDVVIVDLGLPDGRGESLIRELAMQVARRSVVIGTSGDPSGRAAALAAGAAGFLDKPVESLRAFAETLTRHLPSYRLPGVTPPGLPEPEARVVPDPLALHDDLAHAAALLEDGPDARARGFAARFVEGLARAAHDPALEAAARAAEDGAEAGSLPLRDLIGHRLGRAGAGGLQSVGLQSGGAQAGN